MQSNLNLGENNAERGNSVTKRAGKSNRDIIIVAGATMLAISIILPSLVNRKVSKDSGGENAATKIGEDIFALADAEVNLRTLIAEGADDEAIIKAISGVKNAARTLVIFTPTYDIRSAEALVLELEDARDAINDSIPIIDSEFVKTWAQGEAEDMNRRIWLRTAHGHQAEGKVEITDDEKGETLVNGIPLNEWFLALPENNEG